MPSLRAIVSYASGFVSQLPLLVNTLRDDVSPYEPLSAAPLCPLDGPMSCRNSTPVAGDPCCFVHPAGRMVLAQVWDMEGRGGVDEEDWMLRGLWPDLCDGTTPGQPTFPTPQYTNITAILRYHAQDDLLEFMNRYWLTSPTPWHQYAPTINTLSPACYPHPHTPGIEAIDYLFRTAALYRTLDTYRALAHAQIVPHEEKGYPLRRVREVLERFSGGRVVLQCVNGAGGQGGGARDVLSEVWYVYFVKGSFQTGEFVPAQELAGALGEGGNCAEEVRYLPKRSKRKTLMMGWGG